MLERSNELSQSPDVVREEAYEATEFHRKGQLARKAYEDAIHHDMMMKLKMLQDAGVLENSSTFEQ